jgi:hypothetical protein
MALTGLTASCGPPEDITWSSEVISPDGTWTATALTYGISGPGNNYLGTAVYLKRSGTRGRGYEVLGYPEDTSMWARGEAPLTVSWPDRQNLKITSTHVPNLDLQVSKFGNIHISVDTSP